MSYIYQFTNQETSNYFKLAVVEKNDETSQETMIGLYDLSKARTYIRGTYNNSDGMFIQTGLILICEQPYIRMNLLEIYRTTDDEGNLVSYPNSFIYEGETLDMTMFYQMMLRITGI